MPTDKPLPEIALTEDVLTNFIYYMCTLNHLTKEQARAQARRMLAAGKLYGELFRALAVINSPQSFEVEDVCADIRAALKLAEGGK